MSAVPIRITKGNANFALMIFAVAINFVLAAEPPQELQRQVEAYFREYESKTRDKTAKEIKESAHGDAAPVAEAVRNARLWESLPHSGEILTTLPNKQQIRAVYSLPKEYDPARPYPLIWCTSNEAHPELTILNCQARFDSQVVNEFVFVAPERNLDGEFHPKMDEPAAFEAMMCDVRRKIHTDSDRWFIVGADNGGDAAWMTAIWHAHVFAGAIVISGYPHVPYPEQLDPLLLENLRDVAILSIWTAPSEKASDDRTIRVAMHNRALVTMAKNANVSLTGLELRDSTMAKSTPTPAPAGHTAAPILDRPEVDTVLKHRRPDSAGPVSRWFRYAGQGNAGWLEGGSRTGEPWTADTISIAPSSGVDASDFITDVLKSKLSDLSGEIKDQRIEITSRDCCSSITLRLPVELVATPRKLTVRWNDRTRFDAEVHADIATMLSEAYEHWELQHPIGCKITLRSQGEEK